MQQLDVVHSRFVRETFEALSAGITMGMTVMLVTCLCRMMSSSTMSLRAW